MRTLRGLARISSWWPTTVDRVGLGLTNDTLCVIENAECNDWAADA